MKPALSQVCSLNSPFETDLEDYATGQATAIEVWLTKLETYLESHTIDDVKRLLEQFEIVVPVASYQGGLLDSQGEKRKESWALFERRLDLCRDLEIETIVVACDVGQQLTQQVVERVQASLVQTAQAAGQRGRRVALEFQARAGFGNNLQTAAALVAEVASPHLGVCLDVFHFHIGPSKLVDLEYLSNDNLFHVQLSDVADVPREFASDSDRIMPGDGEIAIEAIIQYLKSIQYNGHVSIELLNPQIWQIPARQFGEVGMTALNAVVS